MGKHRERHDDYSDDVAQLPTPDMTLDDDAFFEQFQPEKTRRKTKCARNARRRIEELKEDRELAKRLDEYYD
ncbi:MAG: hypothetical protein ACI9FR_001518 [Cryomorphaceae bacterium]|jgi:hypothetical protein